MGNLCPNMKSALAMDAVCESMLAAMLAAELLTSEALWCKRGEDGE